MKRAVNSLLHTVFSRRPLRSVLCWRGPRRGNRAAITFDDGPNDHTTPRVLEILDEYGVRCTFFVLGREIVKHPGILKAIATAGHEIGIHGYDHTGNQMLGQITRCKALLAEQDIACNLFRPPLGRRGMAEWWSIYRAGYRTVLWSVDACDSMRHEGKRPARWPRYDSMRSGDILLMHDDNPICVRELLGLLEALRERELQSVLVSELLA